jgi:glycosyltransferase involved in cell wall biosynthesis
MLVARALEPCDVFIGMSGLCVLSCITARCKYGARVLLERGSTHILRQKEILEKLGGGRVADFDVERELAGYNLADLIVVPSLHAEDSFLRYGFDKQKIFRNPYGVDLEMFPATAVPATREPVAIYVGAWTYQKGCDLWGRVLERIPGLRLIHVGARGDAPMPVSGNFAHVDPVNQWDLLKYYAKAHVCVQASRQEGLSLVLIQALACGLPVVCSDQTGGRDLLQILQDDELVQVFPGDNLDALCSCIRRGMDFALARRGMRSLPEQQRRQLTWRAYGERYSRRLNELVVGRSSSSPRS